MIPADWPRPLALLVTLMRVDEGAPEAAAELAAGLSPAEWETFADLAIERHRVAPLVVPALDSPDLPEVVRDRLDAAVRENALVTMAHIAETRRVREALAAIGVDLAVFKGWPLAERLYGEAAGRHSGDLDILVPEDRVADSWRALEGIGFAVPDDTAKLRRRIRGLGNPQLVRAVRDIGMVRAQTGMTVELHWRLMNFRGWPRFDVLPGAFVPQQTSAGRILTPSDQTNVLYLSTHGSLHLWDQLKWLADIAALARGRGAETLGADLSLAREIGAGRSVALALSLATGLLGSPWPGSGGPADPAVPGLERWMLARMGRIDRPFSLARYHAEIRWVALRLACNWRQRLGVLGYDTVRRLRLLSLDLDWRSREIRPER